MRLRAAITLLLATVGASSPAAAQTNLTASADVVEDPTTSLVVGPPASFTWDNVTPGVTNTYAAQRRNVTVTSTSACGALIVVDPDPFQEGTLVHALAKPVKRLPRRVEIRAGNAANPDVPHIPVAAEQTTLLTYPAPVSNQPGWLDLRQTVLAGDEVLPGNYRKSLTFALVSTCRSRPETTITAGPADLEATNRPAFEFRSSSAVSTFQCRVDGPYGELGTFTPCSSGFEPTVGDEGEYRFFVRSTSAAGDTDLTPAARRFVLDRTAPAATIVTGPSGLTTDPKPQLEFTSFDSGARFECRLDGPGAVTGSYTACTSPLWLFWGLQDGSYTFAVRAIDHAGNVGAPPETRTFTIDTVAPDAAIVAGPAGPSASASPSFTFASPEPGASLECWLDGPGNAPALYEPCASPQAYASLPDGAYTFSARARDAAGNASNPPANRSFIVDTTAPDTAIDPGPDAQPSSPTRSFAFTSTEAGSTFECALDGPYKPCWSPWRYDDLAVGAHMFSVRARDAAGNADASPAMHAFNVTDVDCLSGEEPDPTDKDHDRIVCEPFPSGTLPPEPGKKSHLEASGTVYVERAGRMVLFEGNATVTLKTPIDARRGKVKITTAANGFGPGDPRAMTQTVTAEGGVFWIEQKQGVKRRDPIHVSLRLINLSNPKLRLLTRSAPKHACTSSLTEAAVNRLTVAVKRRDRVIGLASISTAKNSARFTVADRCDRTRTSVAKGTVEVVTKGKHKTKTILRQGDDHTEKARKKRRAAAVIARWAVADTRPAWRRPTR